MLEKYNDKEIRFKNVDGQQWVCLTDMSKATGKRVSNWTQLASTKNLLSALESIAGIPVITSNPGGIGISENDRGSWGNKLVAIEFAGWCSIEFKIWTLQKLDELISTGSTSLTDHTPAPTRDEIIRAFLPETPKEWKCKYQPSFCSALEQTYGLKRGQRACGKFISDYIYKWFPEEVQDRLKEINPLLEDGYSRENLIHQHFDHYLEDMLKKHIDIVTTKLIQAESKEHFKFLMDFVNKYDLSGIVKV